MDVTKNETDLLIASNLKLSKHGTSRVWKKAKTGLGKLLSGMYAKSSIQNNRSIREKAETEIRHYLKQESTDIDTNPLV